MWDDRYSTENYFYGTNPNDFLKVASEKLNTNSRILCLAEGEGRNAVYLAGLGHNVTGVDFSNSGYLKATSLAKEKNVQIDYVVADLSQYDFGVNKWDAIVSIFCHLPSDLRKNVMVNVVSALKPNGLYIVEAYTPDQLTLNTGGPKNVDFLLTEQLLKNELPDLRWDFIQSTQREVLEGDGHTGLSFVVQGIARKS